MAKYKVCVKYEWWTEIEVEADNEMQAMSFAIDEAEAMPLDGDYDIDGWEELDEED